MEGLSIEVEAFRSLFEGLKYSLSLALVDFEPLDVGKFGTSPEVGDLNLEVGSFPESGEVEDRSTPPLELRRPFASLAEANVIDFNPSELHACPPSWRGLRTALKVPGLTGSLT